MSNLDDKDVVDSDIAVIGMACRLPGARNVRDFWRNLQGGVESVRQYSDAELSAEGVDPELLLDPSYVKAGAPLEDMEMFDAGFFGLSPLDAAIMDPQHRHFLECAWEALEDAGQDPSRFVGNIGVFAGSGVNTYMMYNILSNPRLLKTVGFFLLRHTGNDKDFLTTRVSYHFNLRGPSINVQTACSTSLVATHLACQSLLNGECEIALAGGVTIEMPHRRGYLYQEGEILSPDGHCRAFDAESKGTIFGSGAGVVVLRRLRDAIAHGDNIHAVIKGSAINNDGSTKVGYLAPSVDGQAQAIAEAIAMAGVKADEIGYVETHGTGTPVGDPIEIAALTQAFRQTTARKGFCPVGSLKSNIGHLDTAAGVASLIKVVLALKHRQVPPSLHFERPNPSIDFAQSPFFVNDKLRDWPADGTPRLAGVSSLGVGGTNAHLVLEEAPRLDTAAASRPWKLFLFSARDKAALDPLAKNLATHLKEHPGISLDDAAYTTQVGRQAFQHRRILVARSADDAAAAVASEDRARLVTQTVGETAPSIVFMFPGGGAQYPNMGLELYREEPVYREEMDRCLGILSTKLGIDLKPLMYPREGEVEQAARQLERPLSSVLSVFVTEYALAKLWLSWGIVPSAMTGHSLGEYTAACLAGVMSLEDTLALVACRGRLFERMPEGGMLGVPLPEQELRPLLGPGLSVAAANSPGLCVASGSTQAIRELESQLTARGVESNRIRISVAAHSAMLDPFLDEFASFARTIRLSPPKMPYISNLTGSWGDTDTAPDRDYWVRHLRQTVRFSDGMAELIKEPNRVYLEVGPGTTLTSLAKQHLGAAGAQRAISSLRHPKETISDLQFLLTSLGRLWLCGCEIDWRAFHRGEPRRRVSLPTYPFQHQRYWTEPGKQTAGDQAAAKPLRKLPDPADWTYRPVWEQRDRSADEKPAAPLRVLVFLDARSRFGAGVVKDLRNTGHEVVQVRAGDSFAVIGTNEYTLAAERREDYEALVQELTTADKMPDRILHLWLVTEDESARGGSNFFHRCQERGFYSLVFLAQALGSDPRPKPLHISVFTSGMQQVDREPLPYPEKATVLGPCRVLPREYPGVTCTTIDLTLAEYQPRGLSTRAARDRIDAGLRRLVEEGLTPGAETVIAYREGKRHVLAHRRAQLTERGAGTRLRDGGVYLITGGLGGIGLVMAEHIARRVKAKLVLLGRSALPGPEAREEWLRTHAVNDPTSRRLRRLREIERLGSEVLPLAADVANVEDMQAALAQVTQRFGAVNGILHTAGVIDDGLIQMKTQADAERVFSAKVHGTALLDRLLRSPQLDFLVLFSSTSAILGPAGQVDYAAANAFLNAFAQSKSSRASACQTVAVNWGLWQKVGMAAKALSPEAAGELAAAVEGHPVDHPLLATCIRESDEERIYAGEYSPQTHWILDHHRTRAGDAVLPGTGYLEIARASLSGNGVSQDLEIRDVSFIEPLFVPEEASREIRVQLRRDADAYSFEVLSRPHAHDGSAPWQSHAQGKIGRRQLEPAARLPLAEIAARCPRLVESGAGKSLPIQDKQLRFGPRWQCLRRIHFGQGEALAFLELPRELLADLETYKLHPALLDLATGFGISLIEGYERCEDLYVPMSYRRLKVHSALRGRMYSHVRCHGQASIDKPIAKFDVTITDEDGNVLLEVDEFVIRRLASRDLVRRRGEAAARAGRGHLSPQQLELQKLLAEGILPEEGTRALDQILASDGMAQVVVTSLDLHRLIEKAGEVKREDPAEEKAARPKLEGAYLAARDDAEKTLVKFWEELLGVDKVGIKDSFFDLGGHSLIAVRLMARIKKSFKSELPLSVLFEAPTIEQLATVLRGELAVDAETAAGEAPANPAAPKERAHSLLVPLSSDPKATRPPFFLIAGMYGNIMNLRHLASHIGKDQPFYGVQARGLFGEERPYDTFEPMAADYIREIKKAQPQGPYYLGGFSGGGVTAYEMARQLKEQGDEVALLVFLDTFSPTIPSLTRRDRVLLLRRRLEKIGPRYFLHGVRKKSRLLWQGLKSRLAKPTEELQTSDFRSAAVGEAFTRAVRTYRVPRYDGEVVLIRPQLDQVYELEPGRWVNAEGGFVGHANYWDPFIERIQVDVVTGDHNSMVLEPHVRVLAGKLRAHLVKAQARATGQERSETGKERREPVTESRRGGEGIAHPVGSRREALAARD